MREFAVVVINFLREYYDDAYRYSCTLNQGVPWRDSLTLDVRDDYLTIHISENQMFALMARHITRINRELRPYLFLRSFLFLVENYI